MAFQAFTVTMTGAPLLLSASLPAGATSRYGYVRLTGKASNAAGIYWGGANVTNDGTTAEPIQPGQDDQISPGAGLAILSEMYVIGAVGDKVFVRCF